MLCFPKICGSQFHISNDLASEVNFWGSHELHRTKALVNPAFLFLLMSKLVFPVRATKWNQPGVQERHLGAGKSGLNLDHCGLLAPKQSPRALEEGHGWAQNSLSYRTGCWAVPFTPPLLLECQWQLFLSLHKCLPSPPCPNTFIGVVGVHFLLLSHMRTVMLCSQHKGTPALPIGFLSVSLAVSMPRERASASSWRKTELAREKFLSQSYG